MCLLSPGNPQFHQQHRFFAAVNRFIVRPMSSIAGNEPVQRMMMRAPCPGCGCAHGTITTKNGQDTVRCAECARYCYNAPRTETGREPRSLRTRPTIRPSQRTRILLRDNGACVLCHRHDVPLDVGHLISVHDGHALGLSDAMLDSDGNLAAMCASCNSGLSDVSLPPHLVAAALRAQSKRAQRRRPA
jgi:5-methylcytosine-specific restriction endonuclease McrA